MSDGCKRCLESDARIAAVHRAMWRNGVNPFAGSQLATADDWAFATELLDRMRADSEAMISTLHAQLVAAGGVVPPIEEILEGARSARLAHVFDTAERMFSARPLDAAAWERGAN